MEQRSVPYSNNATNLGADQQSQEYLGPEHCVLFGNFTGFPHPNAHGIIPGAGNIGNFYSHHIPEHQEGALFYGVQQQHPATNVATSSNHFNPYVAAPYASTDFPVPVNHGLRKSWAAALPYFPGGTGGSVNAGNMGVQGYPITSSNRGLTSFVHPPVPQGPPYHHHLPPNMQCMGGYSPQVMPSSSRNTDTPFRVGSRYIRPFVPTGLRLYGPHRRDLMLGANTGHRFLPNGVAMLDAVDQHRDMRLDIDHMSYEELLALEERIGNVTTGISEEAIVTNLKTRIFLSSETPALETVAASQDHKTDFCVICQTDYDDQEKIGILECGHEYHEECVKKWLVMKNTCPICKSTALSTEKKDVKNTGKEAVDV